MRGSNAEHHYEKGEGGEREADNEQVGAVAAALHTPRTKHSSFVIGAFHTSR